MPIVQYIGLDNFVALEPISLGELLTILSTIILLIITWKSVINADHANKITKENQKLQQEQFELSIKPELTFKIPPIRFTSDYYDKQNFSHNLKPDFDYSIGNLSTNIAYDINVTTFIYLPSEGWEKYYSFLRSELGQSKGKPNVVSHRSIYSLGIENYLRATIPHYYLSFDVLAYDGTINSPEIYVYLTYKDKSKRIYEDYFLFHKTTNFRGQFSKPDDVEIYFYPKNISKEKFKKNLFNQKKKLESDFPDEGILVYYNLK